MTFSPVKLPFSSIPHVVRPLVLLMLDYFGTTLIAYSTICPD